MRASRTSETCTERPPTMGAGVMSGLWVWPPLGQFMVLTAQLRPPAHSMTGQTRISLPPSPFLRSLALYAPNMGDMVGRSAKQGDEQRPTRDPFLDCRCRKLQPFPTLNAQALTTRWEAKSQELKLTSKVCFLNKYTLLMVKRDCELNCLWYFVLLKRD